MKVYLNNYDLSKLNIDYDTSYNQNFIYSHEGIYGFKNNKLYKMDIIEKEFETNLFKDYEFLIDYSELVFAEVVYHIPYEHIMCNETFYRKNIGNGITFVKRTYFDQTSYYFEIEGILESFMFSKMFTFVI